MKKLIVLCIFCISNYSNPIVAWDSSPTPNITSYKIYWAFVDNGATNKVFVNVPTGMGTQVTLTLTNNIKYMLWSTALIGTNESSPSNILLWQNITTNTIISPPLNFRFP